MAKKKIIETQIAEFTDEQQPKMAATLASQWVDRKTNGRWKLREVNGWSDHDGDTHILVTMWRETFEEASDGG